MRQVFGLGSHDLALLGSTLRGYYVSCTMNILSLNALLLLMKDSHAAHRPAASPPPAPIAARQRLPMEKMARLLDPAEMPPHVAELAWRLNSLGERGDGRILASLYRYLANWPPLLGATWALIAPLAGTRQLAAAVEEGLADAEFRARQLVSRLAPPSSPPDGPTHRAICVALEEFGRNAIAKVIPITRALLMVVGTRVDPRPP